MRQFWTICEQKHYKSDKSNTNIVNHKRFMVKIKKRRFEAF